MSKVFIIAEAGVNHNGSIEIAKKLIDEAAKCGVDAVKFQSFKAKNLVTKIAKQADYQKENMKKEVSQYEMLKALELSYDDHIELINYSKEKGIMFLSSPFDLESIDMLMELGIEIFKVPSGEIENVPYLKKIAKTGKKVILSTGMSNLADIEFALDILREAGAKDISVLHCNTDYPTKMEEVNLTAMNTIGNAFLVEIGYSDHTKGIEIPIAAVALGAKIIEKHFTLDKNMDGPDHKASLEPDELKAMVDSIRNVEIALGNGIKALTNSEKKNIKVARKSIICSSYIKKGEVFTEENLTIKRPGTGLSPKMWDKIIGKKAQRDYNVDEMVEL
ncbi:N-acetylneuraminate synthase [Clostridium sartagoforme]|uniref:N-acetylneuraminate synthase n=1 Tax=Clostridium sartagoforme TaxID=84031 RepID=A0A4S2DKJ5_9CLOT|nr:N-acetylneuraminate synthase [Clostridium sartagoforme]TGY42455.1 N-acetylneuraminate synthase [Clostridium sartagoforme]